MMSKIRLYLSIMPLIVFLAGFNQVNAQVKSGVRAGLNYPGLSFNPQHNNGYHLGAYVKVSLAGIVAVEPGMQYAHKQFTSDQHASPYKMNLNFLEVPVLFRLSVFPFINVFGGPQASVLLGKRSSGDMDYALWDLPRHEVGGVAGIGVKLPLGFNIQGSYDFGLADLEYQGQQIKNRTFKLSLGKNF